jgi:TPR repeat protein
MYYHGHGGLGKDNAKAEKWWRKGAEQGFAPAQHALGFLCSGDRHGNSLGGVPVDYDKALKWCGRARSQGYITAGNCLRYVRRKKSGY